MVVSTFLSADVVMERDLPELFADVTADVHGLPGFRRV